MIIMLGLLSTYNVVAGHHAWFDSFPYKVQCLFDDLIGNISGLPSYFLIASLISLSLGYTIDILSLFESTTAMIYKWTFKKPTAALDHGIEAVRRKRRRIKSGGFSAPTIYFDALLVVTQTVLRILRALFTVINICLSSRGCGLAFDLGFFAFGLYSLVSDRLKPIHHTDGNEDELTFGQIVPLVLLSSIILVFKESYEGW